MYDPVDTPGWSQHSLWQGGCVVCVSVHVQCSLFLVIMLLLLSLLSSVDWWLLIDWLSTFLMMTTTLHRTPPPCVAFQCALLVIMLLLLSLLSLLSSVDWWLLIGPLLFWWWQQHSTGPLHQTLCDLIVHCTDLCGGPCTQSPSSATTGLQLPHQRVHHGQAKTQVSADPSSISAGPSWWSSSTKNTNYGAWLCSYYWCLEQEAEIGFSFRCGLSPVIESSLSMEASWISSFCPILAHPWVWCWDNWIRLARASGLHVRLYCWCWSRPLWLLKLFRRQYLQIRLLMIFGKLVDSCLCCVSYLASQLVILAMGPRAHCHAPRTHFVCQTCKMNCVHLH